MTALADRPRARDVGRRIEALTSRLPGILHGGVVTGVMIFLLAPIVIVIMTSFSETRYIVFPPQGFTLQWYQVFFENAGMVRALWLSTQVAAATTVLSVSLGLATALALDRMVRRGVGVTLGLATAPLIVPQIAIAIALLIVFSQLQIAGSVGGLIAAHTMLALPFSVVLISSALTAADRSVEDAARNLGASQARTIFTVTIPQIGGSIGAAAFFSFITSFDELTVSLFISGPRTATLPIKMFGYIQYQADPSVSAISTVLVLLAAAGAFAMTRFSNLTSALERN